MNKLLKISCLAAVTFCLLTVNAIAAKYDRINYGSLIGAPVTADSDMGLSHNITVHNNGGYTYGRTSEEAYGGKASYYVDYTSATGDFQILDTGSGIEYHALMKSNPVYAEMYIKGADFTMGTITPQLFFMNNSDVNIGGKAEWSYDAPDEKGWVRCYTHLYVSSDYTGVHLGLYINRKDSADVSMDRIYVDNIQLILIPNSIETGNISCETSYFDLDNLRIFGRNVYGTRREIFAKDKVKYTVLSGNAYTDDCNVLTARSAGRVYLEADFYGKTTELYVDFARGEGGIWASTPEVIGGICRAMISNEGDVPEEVRLQVVLTDGGRLVKLTRTHMQIMPGEASEISADVSQVPFYVLNPQYICTVLVYKNGVWIPVTN